MLGNYMRKGALDIYKMLEKLPVVFDIHAFSLVSGKKRKDCAVYLKKFVDKQLIYRIRRGLYAKANDPVIIAGNLPFPSYITGAFALFYYGKGEAPSMIDVASEIFIRKLNELPLRFHITKCLGDFQLVNYAGYSIKLATLEQAKKDIRRFRIFK